MKKHLLLWLLIVIFVVPGYSQIAQPAVPVNVAILVYNDVELLDFAGPLEVLSLAYRDTTKLFNVYTVGLNNESITSQKALRITPQYSLENCPVPNILVLPGGDTRVIKKNEELIKWITKSIDSIDIALSVCTGVSILGEAGLLDNQRATTHKYAIERMQENYPKASFLANTRFVDNGKIITTAGISAGIDGALYVVQRLFGEEVARDIVDWMEYDSWRPDNGLIMVNRKTIIQDLCWSPDNIYVYFSAMKVKPDFSDYSPQLWTVYRFDTNKKNIKPIEKSALNVAVSPSGNQLAIAKNEIDQRNIFILDEDGKDIWALVIGPATLRITAFASLLRSSALNDLS